MGAGGSREPGRIRGENRAACRAGHRREHRRGQSPVAEPPGQHLAGGGESAGECALEDAEFAGRETARPALQFAQHHRRAIRRRQPGDLLQHRADRLRIATGGRAVGHVRDLGD
jgi:hypothetical protein